MTTNKNWKPEVYDQKFADNFDLLSRLLISGAREESDDYTVDADTDSVIIQTGASKTVTLPTSAAANKDRAYIIRYTNATQAADLVDAAANVIVDATDISQWSVFLCISAGDTSLGNNAYYVVAFTGAQALTS